MDRALPSRDYGGGHEHVGPLLGPWGPEEILRWLSISGIALVLCVVAWYLAAGESRPIRQVGPVNLGIVAVIIAAAANVSFIQRGRRATGERRRSLLGEPRRDRALAPGTSGGGAIPVSDLLVGTDGLRYFHRSDCPMALGRTWTGSDRASHESAGRAACAVCRP
jgi:hypothetical protein